MGTTSGVDPGWVRLENGFGPSFLVDPAISERTEPNASKNNVEQCFFFYRVLFLKVSTEYV